MVVAFIDQVDGNSTPRCSNEVGAVTPVGDHGVAQLPLDLVVGVHAGAGEEAIELHPRATTLLDHPHALAGAARVVEQDRLLPLVTRGGCRGPRGGVCRVCHVLLLKVSRASSPTRRGRSPSWVVRHTGTTGGRTGPAGRLTSAGAPMSPVGSWRCHAPGVERQRCDYSHDRWSMSTSQHVSGTGCHTTGGGSCTSLPTTSCGLVDNPPLIPSNAPVCPHGVHTASAVVDRCLPLLTSALGAHRLVGCARARGVTGRRSVHHGVSALDGMHAQTRHHTREPPAHDGRRLEETPCAPSDAALPA